MLPSSRQAGSAVDRRLQAYLELLRPANVATALADVLAGAAVATGGRMSGALAWLLAASACLYAGGIVLNDYFDRQLDARERPERPIPSHRIAASTAAWLGAALLALGIAGAALAGRAPLVVATALAAAIVTYDAWGKHRAFIGPVNMGLCRALNLLLGISLVPAVLGSHGALGLLPLVYIAAVTMVSRGEVSGAKRPVALAAFILVAAVIAALAWVSAAMRPLPATAWNSAPLQLATALTLAAWLAWRVLPAFWRAVQDPVPAIVRRAVRTGVLSLVLVDGVIAASYAGIIYVLAVLATGLLAWWLARLFAVT